jgi:hypothetical protein
VGGMCVPSELGPVAKKAMSAARNRVENCSKTLRAGATPRLRQTSNTVAGLTNLRSHRKNLTQIGSVTSSSTSPSCSGEVGGASRSVKMHL